MNASRICHGGEANFFECTYKSRYSTDHSDDIGVECVGARTINKRPGCIMYSGNSDATAAIPIASIGMDVYVRNACWK